MAPGPRPGAPSQRSLGPMRRAVRTTPRRPPASTLPARWCPCSPAPGAFCRLCNPLCIVAIHFASNSLNGTYYCGTHFFVYVGNSATYYFTTALQDNALICPMQPRARGPFEFLGLRFPPLPLFFAVVLWLSSSFSDFPHFWCILTMRHHRHTSRTDSLTQPNHFLNAPCHPTQCRSAAREPDRCPNRIRVGGQGGGGFQPNRPASDYAAYPDIQMYPTAAMAVVPTRT